MQSNQAKPFSAYQLREDFPALAQSVNGVPLVYLDSAATSQKPRSVIQSICRYYENDNANVHRGVHALSERATAAYENARGRAAKFFGAEAQEIVFTRGATEGVNLLANTLKKRVLGEGKTILLTEMEHHSNIVPWQMVAQETGAVIRYIPVVPETGMLDEDEAKRLFAGGVAIFSCTHISNTLGTVNPVQSLCAWAREAGAVSIIDAAQSAGHRKVDVREIGCDFLVCSGHKMCGPMGVGVLYGEGSLLQDLPPWQGGGEMISRVTYEGSTWNKAPHKFEAGTPNVEGAIGLHAAMDYLDAVGREEIRLHDALLVREAMGVLSSFPGVRIFGPVDESGEHAGVVSFALPGIHAHDVVTLADSHGIALRGGHHCNQPLMKKLGVPATARASFYFYNTEEDVEALRCSVEKIMRMFSKL